MFYIPEAEELNLLDAKSKVNFEEIINNKRFTIKDSSMTYRQANSMSNDNMLPNDKGRNNGWRKFSLKELIYIELVVAVKKLGLQHYQLRNIKDSFFTDYEEAKNTGRMARNISDDVIALVMGHVDIILTITEDGNISYLHPSFFTIFYPNSEPFVFVGLSDIVNRVMRKINKAEFIPKATISSVSHSLTPIEQKVLGILRDKKYKNVKLTKRDGQVELIHAEKIEDDSSHNIDSIISAITNGRYQKVSVTQRDGKIVNVSLEDTVKV